VALPDGLVDEGTADSLPAVGRPLEYFTISSELARDSRDRPRNPHRGGFLSLSVSHLEDRGEGRYSFRRLTLDGRRYLPLGSERHLLALARASATLALIGALFAPAVANLASLLLLLSVALLPSARARLRAVLALPLARATKNGSPPTARKARTGLFTPPGKYRAASSNNCRERSPMSPPENDQ
jgi:hypothetical protein